MSPNLRQSRVPRKASSGAACLLAVAAVSCSPSGAEPPSVIVFQHAAIATLDSLRPSATTLAIRDGRITAIDGTGETDGEGVALIPLNGARVTPAFVDHHVHLFNVGWTLLNDRDHERLFVDLSHVTALSDVGDKIRTRARSTPPGAWILGAGWNQAAWGASDLPTAATLDSAAPDHPVYLARSDGHAGWLNHQALRLAGFDHADSAGGSVLRAANGEPAGAILERANDRVLPLVPAAADSDIAAAYQLAAAALAARGVTRVYDAGVLPPPGVVGMGVDLAHYLAVLQLTDSLHPLPLDVHLMIPAPSALAESLLAHPPATWVLSPRLRITHLKLFADGTLGSRGAALSHPYADAKGTTGVPRMSASEIAALTLRALDAGLGVATHAIGDEAVHRALDAYARVLHERPGVDAGRLRIEHFSYASAADMARAVRLGVVLSVQSGFNSAADDSLPFGALRVGRVNEPRVYAWTTLAGLHAKLAEGSDYFTRPAPALYGFRAAIDRRYGVASQLPDKASRVAAASFEATWYDPGGGVHRPTVAVGADADLIVLNADPMVLPRPALDSVRVVATLRHGRLTYVSRELAPPALQRLAKQPASP